MAERFLGREMSGRFDINDECLLKIPDICKASDPSDAHCAKTCDFGVARRKRRLICS